MEFWWFSYLPKILLHFSAKRIHKSKRRRRRTGDNAEEPIESDGALEDTSGEEDDEEGMFWFDEFFLDIKLIYF